MKKLYRVLVLSASVLGISACSSMSSVLPDKAVDYKRATEAQRNLAIPPDLTADRMGDEMSVPGGSAKYSQYAATTRQRTACSTGAGSKSVLPPHPGIQVIRDGTNRWLQVDAGADAVWDRVVAFWQGQGIPLVMEDPKAGIMRTSWVESRPKVGSGFIDDTIYKLFNGLYSTGKRDSYRVRLEREPGGKTDIFLTQYGLQQVLDHGVSGEAQQPVWVPRPRDPHLEAVMLQRLMVSLGDAQNQAKSQLASAKQYTGQPRGELVQSANGTPKLIVAQDFPRAWNLVGLLLDRVGFAVNDRNRSKGIYYVSYNNPAAQQSGGFFSKLEFWNSNKPKPETKYQIRLSSAGQDTAVEVYDDKGQLASGSTPKRILELLSEQLH